MNPAPSERVGLFRLLFLLLTQVIALVQTSLFRCYPDLRSPVCASMNSSDSKVITIPQEPAQPSAPPPRSGLRVRIIGRALFVFSLLVSASIGALLGFVLVYSTDL